MASRSQLRRRYLLLAEFLLLNWALSAFAQDDGNDFDFSDQLHFAAFLSPSNDSAVTEKKAVLSNMTSSSLSAVKWDDDEYVNDDPSAAGDNGSGVEEGSAVDPTEVPDDWTTPFHPPDAATTAPTVVDEHADVFRVTMNCTSIPYSVELGDRNSDVFREAADLVKDDVEAIYQDLPGTQTANILQFRPGSVDPGAQPSVIVTLDLSSVGADNRLLLFNVLNDALNRGYLSQLRVSPSGFSFRPITGSGDQCPRTMGREPTSLPRLSDDLQASLMLNNQAKCDSFLYRVSYFRGSPDGTAFVGVWRQVADEQYILKHRIQLPVAPIGIHHVDLPEPLPLERGDFLGIHYPRDAQSSVVAHSVPADQVLKSDEFYQTLVVQATDEDFPHDRTFRLSAFPSRLESRTFALQGLLEPDYATVIPPTEQPICSEYESQCNDGSCIDLRMKCDGRIDCPDSSDESDCNDAEVPTGQCKQEEFACNSGECIDIAQRCDQTYQCDDGSDEFECWEPTVTDHPPAICDRSQFQCEQDGRCIEASRVCDGTNDCTDGTDEYNCVGNCREGQFTCSTGMCIDESLTCNSRFDCDDGSDEFDCLPSSTRPTPSGCSSTQWQCDDGKCIDLSQRCDRSAYHCDDGSDELNCLEDETTTKPTVDTCGETQWQCGDGTCIELSQRCDRSEYHCQDGTDEFNCDDVDEERTEPPVEGCDSRAEFTCNDGTCIDIRQKCDNEQQCRDGSDELDCESSSARECSASEWQCADGACIKLSERCDWTAYHCQDGSDEYNCPSPTRPPPVPCEPNEFACGDDTCIDSSMRCDGKYDCGDGTDEFDCEAATTPASPPQQQCEASQWQCGDGKCIERSQRCDYTAYHCDDGSDELNCHEQECAGDQFQCEDGTCIDSQLRCNRNNDCSDQSDEINCECPADQFQCGNGQCIDLRRKCDSRPDCSDRTDEQSCPSSAVKRVTISPSQLRIREGVDAVFQCRVEGFSSRLSWSRQPQGLPERATEQDGRLVVAAATVADSGEYVCTAIDEPEVKSSVVRLTVEAMYGPTLRPPISTGHCEIDEAMCTNGVCIQRDYVCDGDYDCTDRSDETNCLRTLPCEPNEFQCGGGKCILKIWRCDGDNDCSDNTDELNCATAPPGSACRADEYQCEAGDQCIPASYHCDGELDCLDKSDEVGCTPPTVIKAPPNETHARQGETITIVCEAIGVPPPLIIWRQNWGHTGPSPRVTSITEKIGASSAWDRGRGGGIGVSRGELTIRQARIDDEGAYTCEAINSKGSIFAIPDSIVHVLPKSGICNPPQFNTDAQSPRDCVSCYCFERTQDCQSCDMFLSEISGATSITLVKESDLSPIARDPVLYDPQTQQFTVEDYDVNVPSDDVYYWSLPSQFLGNKVTSYGSELKYTVYAVDPYNSQQIEQGPDVVVRGSGNVLYHYAVIDALTESGHSANVRLVEKDWYLDKQRSRAASRADLMNVLQKVESILIKSRYYLYQHVAGLGDLSLGIAVHERTNRGRAVLVESCNCPAEYMGTSCEQCSPGYFRQRQGRQQGQCVPCQCNGRARSCDPETGECLDCQDNTFGKNCERCKTGFYSTSPVGQPVRCRPCPCPHPAADNPFTSECFLDTDGDVTCRGCPPEYTGRRCHQCAVGYEGNPLTVGDTCRPAGQQCDLRGSTRAQPDRTTGQCSCKANVIGQRCNSCKPNTFHLSDASTGGCTSCFCMGVAQSCTSTTWNKAKVVAVFTDTSDGIALTDRSRENIFSDQGLNVDSRKAEITFTEFYSLPTNDYYWILPEKFLGDKVTSYGGFLTYTVQHVPGFDTTVTTYPDVEISGNGIVLMYGVGKPQQILPNAAKQILVPFYEQHWVRSDGVQATREDLMMVLAKLDYVLIKAKYTMDVYQSSLRELSMDTADSQTNRQDRAFAVEECACPPGYRGLSCESCDEGYYRTPGGPYLGTCVPCNCNGHSTECDSSTGQCKNCQHNTAGKNCDECAHGYYGDATRGSVGDCQPCPCPLTSAPNQFSPTCRLDSDGDATCTACPTGHQGRRCESCSPGYYGNPFIPGDYCRSGRDDDGGECSCDDRGTVPNTRCDAVTKSCQCKVFVEGAQCQTCQNGYFYLSESNAQGCLSCYCMGVTNQCVSSSYYRTTIEPNYTSDHGIKLVSRRLSQEISSGITANQATRAIQFIQFANVRRERESLFWKLPSKFTGNQLASYGGKMQFQLTYTLTNSPRGQYYYDADVEIVSGDNRFYMFLQPSPTADGSNSYSVLMTELDGTQPSRQTFLQALASIDAILIRSTFHTNTESSSLTSLSMETATPEAISDVLADSVEQCTCPPGYSGLSCELCAAGYSRVPDRTLLLGRCVPCNCNGHSQTCNQQTGNCENCQHNTEGNRCERCTSGYYGNALAGTPNDCKKCLCPLGTNENQFSPTCILDKDNLPTCDKCQEGYAGRNCDVCAPGFVGNPRIPGDRCVRFNGNDRPDRLTIMPPRFTTAAGGDVTFRCYSATNRGQVKGPARNVQWQRADGRPMSSRVTTSGNMLIMKRVESTDAGRYICQSASSQNGQIRAEAELVVSVERLLTVVVKPPKEHEVPVGGSTTFTCTGISQYAYTLSWSRQDGRPLSDNTIDLGEGTLIISDVQPEDEGTYVCTGSNPYVSTTDTAVLTLSEGNQAPSVRVQPDHLAVDTGDSVEFHCFSTGHPRPRIEWSRADGQPLPIDAVIEDSVLRFQAVTTEHQGEYVCTGMNTVGDDHASAILEVRSDIEPTFEAIVNQPQKQVVAGGDAQLGCAARGNIAEVDRIEWKREGGELPHGAYQLNGQLVIPECKPTDGGRYICTIHLISGESRIAYTTLIISPQSEERPETESPTAVIRPEQQTIGQGSSASFQCVTTGSPNPSVKWSKVGGELSSNTDIQGDVLYINNAQPEDRGLYLCEVENEAGGNRASAVLEVERYERPLIEIYPSNSITVEVGASPLFLCRAVEGIPTPEISWTRADNSPMTANTKLTELGVLQFTEVTGDEQGQYICTASNAAGTDTVTVELIVADLVEEFAPEVRVTPNTQKRRPGDLLTVQCSARGTEPISYEWSKVDGLLSSSATTNNDGLLEIEEVTARDGGTYKCVATNRVGQAEAEADVVILVPPSAVITQRTLTARAGQTVELNCQVTGSPRPTVTWTKESSVMPEGRHAVIDGLLRLYNVEVTDSGRYACFVSNEVGRTRDYAQLTVIPGEENDAVSDQQQIVQVGDTIRIDCDIRSSPQPWPTLQWVRVDGVLPVQAEVVGNTLVIPFITEDDQGTYRCMASQSAGMVYAQVTVTVQGPPVASVSKQSRVVAVGANVTINCQVQSNPPATISWSKQAGQLPSHHLARENWLNINPIRLADFGEYVCTGRNEYGSSQSIIELIPSELVPYFGHTTQSYISYPVLKDAYSNFDIEVTFTPESADGLILYIGPRAGGRDFVSLSMSENRIEFRFDAGSGATIVESDEVELYAWHTVRLKKDNENGYLYVAGREYRERVSGGNVGLDLSMTLLLGGVQDFRTLPRAVGQRRGVVGCVSRLLVNGIPINLGVDALVLVGVIDCPSCRHRPCQHGGTCRTASTKTGYQCRCAEGYSGYDCELVGTRCQPGSCGRSGKCYNLPDGRGYRCTCPLGKSGTNCEQGSVINLPGFDGTSFASYPTLEDSLTSVQIQLTFFTRHLNDSLLLYDAMDSYGNGDFIALLIRSGRVVFQFNFGSGPVTIVSTDPLQVNRWTTAYAEINNRDGSLILNDGIASKGSSPGRTVGLNLNTPLYIGGIDFNNIRIPADIGVERGFTGCVSQLIVKGRNIDLGNEVIDSANIRDCTADAPPSCALKPCQNGGSCQEVDGSIRCSCLPGFMGPTCAEIAREVTTSAQFPGGYSSIELPSGLMVHRRGVTDTIRMTITTTRSDGLIMWRGQKPTASSRSKDYIALFLVDGYVTLSYELGNGPVNVSSNQHVDDGVEHTVEAVRAGKQSRLIIDNGPEARGTTSGQMTTLDASGNIFIGGTGDNRPTVGSRPQPAFVGCIADVYLNNQGPIHFTNEAIRVTGVVPC